MEFEELKEKCLLCRGCGLGRCIHNGRLSNTPPTPCRDAAPYMLVMASPPYEGGGVFGNATMAKFRDMLCERTCLPLENTYVTTLVKCFTFENRKPTETEIAHCLPLLKAEAEIYRPKLVIALGKTVFKTLTKLPSIDRMRGRTVFSTVLRSQVFPLLSPTVSRLSGPDSESYLSDLAALDAYLRQ